MFHIPVSAIRAGVCGPLVSCAAVSILGVLSPKASQAQQHDHMGMTSHAGGPVDCRTLALPPWSGLPDADRRAIATLQSSLAPLRTTDAATREGFAPTLGDIPTMGVHWVNRSRMADSVRRDQPSQLLFTRIGGRDSLVGVAYAFRGPIDAETPSTFTSDLAHWHDHANLGGAPGQTLHMLHVWFVPSPYGPFAGNNFFLPLMAAGMATPNPCWIASKDEVNRFELVATLVDLLHRQQDSTMTAPGVRRMARRGMAQTGAMGNGAMMQGLLAALGTRVQPQLTALDSAARRNNQTQWEQSADALLGALRPGERQLLTAVRDRITGIQSSTAENRRPRRGRVTGRQ